MKKKAKRRAAIVAALATGALLIAACNDVPAKHSKTHNTASRVITARAHVTGSGGPERWFLTLKGKKRPVAVSKRTAGRCHVGDSFPDCAKRAR